ncbi:MAG: YeeE/YedE family protein [Burkholderiaceae bacterium]|nr:YeeE/YedE family protein [Burkholderiaceae bacterium]
MRDLISLCSGLVFGVGLIASGMTQPTKVLAFLDVFGAWDPSLALVMGGAIAVGSVAFAIARRRRTAWSGEAMQIPTRTTIDRRLIGGGVLFGIGWGLAGFCPGPALVAASSGVASAWVFVAAMLIGMALHDRLVKPD